MFFVYCTVYMISELNLTNNDLDKTQFIFTILDIRMSSYKSCLIDTYYKKLTTKQLFFLIRFIFMLLV